jgi:nicotinamidase-related amidase
MLRIVILRITGGKGFVNMFTRQNTLLLVIDMQERLLPHINESEIVAKSSLNMIECCKILKIPVLVTEQYPEGIGQTVPLLASALKEYTRISKRTFSCCHEPRFAKALAELHKKNILITGIESHVCVFQTTADLIARGYAVQIISDAVGSRTSANKIIGIERMRKLGADISSVESSIFELLETSACPEFKQILRFIK